MSLPSGHPDTAFGQTGLLIVNLGTPDSPDARGLRPYLKQFLSDKRVIESPAVIWQPILRGIILNVRPRKSAHAYAQIWDRETNESPLRRHTREQAEALQEKFGDTVKVAWAMRYGQPSVESRLDALREAGCERIVVMALYPQYSATTTASVHDAVFDGLKKCRWQPALRTGAQWHDNPDYIKALARSVRTQIRKQKWRPDVVVASFHGLPVSYFRKGDPYHCHCAKTARLLREELGLTEDTFKLTFQSRFGPAKWLEPYTDKTIEALAEQGKTKITVITPGFISDCVETLEEIGIGVQEMFLEAGGTHFSTVPCLNASDQAITLLHKLAKRELAGWI